MAVRCVMCQAESLCPQSAFLLGGGRRKRRRIEQEAMVSLLGRVMGERCSIYLRSSDGYQSPAYAMKL